MRRRETPTTNCSVNRAAPAAPIKPPRPKPACVYHFTSTLALPWIVASGELRPSTYRDDTNHYLWATTSPAGERTALASDHCKNDDWEQGRVLLVKFTLPDTGFVPFVKIRKTWTPQQAATWLPLKDLARFGVSKWRCRRDPLPLSSVLRVDVKIYGERRWSRIRATSDHCFEISDDPPTMGFNIDGFEYYSTMVDACRYWVPDREELAEMWESLE